VAITRDEVRRVASLARLRLAEDEETRLTADLDNILESFARLKSVDTTGVEPTAHVLPLVNILREDEVRPSYPVDAMLANAPDAQDGQFRVPRILEE